MTQTTIPMSPGDDVHLTLLMAPQSLNLVTGQDREHLLAFGRAAFEAGKAIAEQGKCLHQIAEPAAAPFMYAIADGYGKAFFEEQGCVSSEAKDLQPEVDSLNQNLDGEPPYAVVPVYTHPTAQGVDALTPAARDVLAERQRQVEQEGYNPEHDDGHVNDEIAAMAAIFVMPEAARDWDARSTNYGNTLAEALLPADWNFPHLGNRRDQLVKGAAMALAEIERIDRGSCYA